MLEYGVAEVREVGAAECAMPVAAIALAAVELGAGLVDEVLAAEAARPSVAVGLWVLFFVAVPCKLVQPAANHLHAGVHFVGFGILHFEVSPIASADEWGDFVPTVFVFPIVLSVDEFLEPLGRQSPLGHLAVAAFGNVDLADR